MNLKIRKNINPGLNRMVESEMDMLRFSILRLARGERYDEKLEEHEMALVLLSGKCEIQAGGLKGKLGPRRDVFSDRAWAAYIPAKGNLSLAADSDMEAALIYAPGRQGLEARIITPDNLNVLERGKPGFERTVVEILVSGVEANHLIVGETFNRSGQWSSYPPHKHEQDVPGIESRQEELYFFRLNPEQGFGFMRVYTDDRSIDQPMVLEQNDLVVIPKGYHPVCAAPGYNLYYLWMLAGPTRTLTMRDDPEHAWVK